jgi:hypothetical protein
MNKINNKETNEFFFKEEEINNKEIYDLFIEKEINDQINNTETDEFGFTEEQKSNDKFVIQYIDNKKTENKEVSYEYLFDRLYGGIVLDGVTTTTSKITVAKKGGIEVISDLIYPSKWFRDENDNVSIEVVALCGNDYITKIIPLKNLRNDFFMEMDSIGFIPIKNNSKDRESLKVFFMGLVNILMKNVKKSNYVSQLGWQEDGSFVMGNIRYSDSGEEKIQVQSNHRHVFKQFYPKGDIAKFKKGIDNFFSIEKLKFHHCYFLIGIATPLLKLAGLNGSVCNLRSDFSGTFKSLTQKMLTGFYTNNVDGHVLDFTYTYVFDTIRTYQNFPVVIEEISEKITTDPETVSKLVYENSGGKSKGRGTSDGGTKDGLSSNANIMTSSNPSIYEAIDKTVEAKLLRVLEIDLCTLQSNKKDFYDDINEQVLTAFQLVKENPGYGCEVIRIIVENKEKVKDMIDKEVKEVFSKFPSKNYRYVVFMIATALVMANILEQIGFKISYKTVKENFDKIILSTQSKVTEYKINADNIIDTIFSSLKIQHIIKTPTNKFINDPNAQEHLYPDAWCLDGKELRIPVDTFENKLFNGKQKGIFKMMASDAINTVFANSNIKVTKEQLTMFKVKNRYYVIEIPEHKRQQQLVVIRTQKEEEEDQEEVNRLFGQN